MSRWNYIPNEILEKILNYHEVVYNYVGNPRWKSVCKQWFNIFQSKKYKSINIKLNDSDAILNTILTSPFNPGDWVKNIDIMEINSKRLFRSKSELLYDLMTHCPNAKKVYVHSYESKDWLYFYKIFKNNDSWHRLESLTRLMDPEDPSITKHYTDCLIILRESLKHLVLTSGMIDPLNCGLLSEFKSVEVLEIENDIVSDIYDCCGMVNLLPSLSRLTVTLSPLNIIRIRKNNTDSREFIASNHSTVRALYIECFTPAEEKDLLYFMDQFSRLEELVIFGDAKLPPWQLQKGVSSITIKKFLVYLNRIPSARVCFSADDCIWFLDLYFEYHNRLIQQGRHNPVRVTYCNDNPHNPDYIEPRRIRSTKKYPIYLTLEDNNSEIVLEFKDNPSEKDSFNYILTEPHLSIEVLDIDLRSPNTTDDAGVCLKLLTQYQSHLRCLKLLYGKLEGYNTTIRYKHKIRDLLFEKVLIKDDALKKAMADFPRLRQLTFHSCVFKSSDQSASPFSFGLQNTSVEHIEIVYEKTLAVNADWILFKTVQSDINEIRYFLGPVDNPLAWQETNYEEVFGNTNYLFNDLKIAIFNIYCRSIKYLTIRKTTKSYSDKDQMRIAF